MNKFGPSPRFLRKAASIVLARASVPPVPDDFWPKVVVHISHTLPDGKELAVDYLVDHPEKIGRIKNAINFARLAFWEKLNATSTV